MRFVRHSLAQALLLALPAASAAGGALPPVPALAPSTALRSIDVTNCGDSGPGSLREAYANALDGDRIELQCGVITLSSSLADPAAAASVTIVGREPFTVIDASGKDRAFVHNGAQILSLQNLFVRNGSYATNGIARGGCIVSSGRVFLQSSVVTACSVVSTNAGPARGGAIYSLGDVGLTSSEVRDSSARSQPAAGSNGSHADGGGIWSLGLIGLSRSTVADNRAMASGKYSSRGGGMIGASFGIDTSTISGNTATIGAGVYFFPSTAIASRFTLLNSTVSGNAASGRAGGMYLKGNIEAFIDNSTVAGNSAATDARGAGVFANDVVIESSIFADNVGGTDLEGLHVGGGSSLVVTSNSTLPFDTIHGDPLLGPLQMNGGPTLTHALLSGSPALDHGSNPNAFDFDQRGQPRVSNGTADIGAFEFQDFIFRGGFDVVR